MLFKSSLNKNAEEMRKYISVNVSLDFEVVQPYIIQAERKYVKRLLGVAQYTELINYYNSINQGSGSGSISGSGNINVGAKSAKLAELLEMVQLPLINLAIYSGIELILTKVSSQGAYRIEGDKQKGLFQYQENSLKNSFKNSGFDGLDDLLLFLEENKNDFPNWKNSSAYTETKTFFINSTKDFDDIYSINESRLVFLTLKKYMRLVENSYIISFICDPLFNELKKEIAADNITPANKKILPHLQTAVAYATVARCAIEMGMTWSDKGLYFEMEGGRSSMFIQTQPDNDRLSSIVSLACKTANDALETVREIMVNDINNYPLYKNSNAYNGGSVPSFNNTGKKSYRC